MHRRRRSAASAVVCLVVPAVLVSGCSSNLDCPAVGTSSTLTVSFTADLPPGSTIGASCESTETCFVGEDDGDRRSRVLSFPGSTPDETTITVLDASGAVLSVHALSIPWTTDDDPCDPPATARATLDPSG
ncbi:hypothetical protein ACFP63_01150 [Oerskovia jenensis]|uniref:Ig-like domain-containing protein n=1 Tax=Oerskovia jenensis TaxID=162169 RepID=A0ABS2LFD5_9CELL|nr:hypothetical protein [Oerskovia jenensis]MBM7479116.1 hypothetical protein [Oerskovia jenensis]